MTMVVDAKVGRPEADANAQLSIPEDSLREPTVEELQRAILDDFDTLMRGVAPLTIEAHGRSARIEAGATFRDRRTGGEARVVHDFMPIYHGDHYFEAGERWKVNGEVVAERINGNGGWQVGVEPTHLAGFGSYLQYLEENGDRYHETGIAAGE